MCTKEEQDVMVHAVRKAGWFRSSLVLIAMLVGLVASVYTFSGTVRSDMKETMDEKIRVHQLESELALEKRLGDVETKVDMILERLPEGQ